MDRTSLDSLLRSVARGEVTPGEAAERLALFPVIDVGFARIDTHRELRTGLPEVIFCPGKTTEQIRSIARAMLAEPGGAVIASRATPEVWDAVRDLTFEGRYDPVGRTIVLRRSEDAPSGVVTVVTGGSSDLPVAHEAITTAEAIGLKTSLIADVGVAGIHRTLNAAPDLRAAEALIVIAGMEGALPSVVAGMVPAPVIAVPTSIGYGASFNGLAALLAMLSSCAPGIAVVNIDNGFGAAVVAQRILRARER